MRFNPEKARAPEGDIATHGAYALKTLNFHQEIFQRFGIGLTEFVIAGIPSEIAAEFSVSIPKAGMMATSYALGVFLAHRYYNFLVSDTGT